LVEIDCLIIKVHISLQFCSGLAMV